MMSRWFARGATIILLPMSSEVDPYHLWLGIPPREQPPHHYRLLGIALFEDSADVISMAAQRQMAHVKQLAAGPHVELSQQVLNALAAARVCLLDPRRKSHYDAELQRRIGGSPTPPPVASGPPLVASGPPSAADPNGSPLRSPSR